MKKLIAIISLLAALAFSASAVTLSQTIASGVMTNIIGMAGGPVRVTQVILVASTTNNASLQFVDTTTNWLLFTNSAYTNILSYGTNYVQTWTNYYGATNSVTNLAYYDVTNSVAGTTNNLPIRISITAPTNGTSRFDNVNYYFVQGLWVTNNSTNPATLTVTFQQ